MSEPTWTDLTRAEKIDLLVEAVPEATRAAVRKRVEDELRGDLVPDPMTAMNVVLRASWAEDHDGDTSEWDRAAAAMPR